MGAERVQTVEIVGSHAVTAAAHSLAWVRRRGWIDVASTAASHDDDDGRENSYREKRDCTPGPINLERDTRSDGGYRVVHATPPRFLTAVPRYPTARRLLTVSVTAH